MTGPPAATRTTPRGTSLACQRCRAGACTYPATPTRPKRCFETPPLGTSPRTCASPRLRTHTAAPGRSRRRARGAIRSLQHCDRDCSRADARPSPGRCFGPIGQFVLHLDGACVQRKDVADRRDRHGCRTGRALPRRDVHLRVAAALADRPHRILALGVGCREMRRYGVAAEHDTAHGLDVAGLRSSIDRFLRRDN